MGNDGDGFNDDLKQMLLPIDVIDSNISPQPFQSHQYKVEDEDNNTNTVSSGTQLNQNETILKSIGLMYSIQIVAFYII